MNGNPKKIVATTKHRMLVVFCALFVAIVVVGLMVPVSKVESLDFGKQRCMAVSLSDSYHLHVVLAPGTNPDELVPILKNFDGTQMELDPLKDYTTDTSVVFRVSNLEERILEYNLAVVCIPERVNLESVRLSRGSRVPLYSYLLTSLRE